MTNKLSKEQEIELILIEGALQIARPSAKEFSIETVQRLIEKSSYPEKLKEYTEILYEKYKDIDG